MRCCGLVVGKVKSCAESSKARGPRVFILIRLDTINYCWRAARRLACPYVRLLVAAADADADVALYQMSSSSCSTAQSVSVSSSASTRSGSWLSPCSTLMDTESGDSTLTIAFAASICATQAEQCGH